MLEIGMQSNTLFNDINLPPIDRYCLCQVGNLFSTFCITPCYACVYLNFARNGRPRYAVGRVPDLQPKISDKSCKFCTVLTGKIVFLPMLMCKPDLASKMSNIKLR